MIEVSNAVLAAMVTKLSMNQVHQKTPLATPIALRVSLRRSSFSNTMLFTVMDTEYIHASTMNIGKQRFSVIMKLTDGQGEVTLR